MRGREFGDAIRALLRAADLTNRSAAELLGRQEAKVSELCTPPEEFDHLMALHHDAHIRDWL